MLGIGFIIAHFVAMQKPQQRKYHSSCNRSVHRGTAHGKQEVKVCKRKTPHLFLMRSFLSPYGDGTKKFEIELGIHQFSPPWGWYKSGMNGLETRTCFRPLAGINCSDYEENHRERGKPSPPLRGLYQEPRNSGREAGAIAPLRGWYCVVFNTYI